MSLRLPNEGDLIIAGKDESEEVSLLLYPIGLGKILFWACYKFSQRRPSSSSSICFRYKISPRPILTSFLPSLPHSFGSPYIAFKHDETALYKPNTTRECETNRDESRQWLKPRNQNVKWNKKIQFDSLRCDASDEANQGKPWTQNKTQSICETKRSFARSWLLSHYISTLVALIQTSSLPAKGPSITAAIISHRVARVLWCDCICETIVKINFIAALSTLLFELITLFFSSRSPGRCLRFRLAAFLLYFIFCARTFSQQQ